MNSKPLTVMNRRDFRVHILVCIPIFWLLFQTLADCQRTYRADHRSLDPGWDPANLKIAGADQAQQRSLQAVFDLQNIPVNLAGEELLATIPGIGPELARRIVAERSRSGPFRMADELTGVAGIGPRRAQQIAPYLSFD